MVLQVGIKNQLSIYFPRREGKKGRREERAGKLRNMGRGLVKIRKLCEIGIGIMQGGRFKPVVINGVN